MGMYDYVVCDRKLLPGDPPAFVRGEHQFQTKDLENTLSEYRISADGTIDVPHFYGTIRFYDSNLSGGHGGARFTQDGEDFEDVDYEATFADGKLAGPIVEVRRERGPALPVKEMRLHSEPKPTAEEVAAWKARVAEPLLGKRVYVLSGGRESGYTAEVVYETFAEEGVRGRNGQLCVKILEVESEWAWEHPGKLELLDRTARDRTFFDSVEAAKASRDARKAEWDAETKRYEELLAARQR